MKWVLSRGRYANVTATMALIVSLGGTSYAAIKLPKDSVGAKQIRADAVSSSKVEDASLLSKDFKAGQLPQGLQGRTGATGPTGTTGATGPAGPPGPIGLAKVTMEAVSGAGEATAFCQSGQRAVGGGGDASGPGDVLFTSVPINIDGDKPGWLVRGFDVDHGPIGDVTSYVVCASP
jgi:hypothetical protein